MLMHGKDVLEGIGEEQLEGQRHQRLCVWQIIAVP